jgi:hypothetical protein
MRDSFSRFRGLDGSSSGGHPQNLTRPKKWSNSLSSSTSAPAHEWRPPDDDLDAQDGHVRQTCRIHNSGPTRVPATLVSVPFSRRTRWSDRSRSDGGRSEKPAAGLKVPRFHGAPSCLRLISRIFCADKRL